MDVELYIPSEVSSIIGMVLSQIDTYLLSIATLGKQWSMIH